MPPTRLLPPSRRCTENFRFWTLPFAAVENLLSTAVEIYFARFSAGAGNQTSMRKGRAPHPRHVT